MQTAPQMRQGCTALPSPLLLNPSFPVGKLGRPPRVETLDGGSSTSNRLHIRDADSGLVFLVGMGAEISLIPVNDKTKTQRTDFKLYGANNSPIDTFGETRLSLNLRLRRPVVWNFCIAAVPYPIIRADLLNHYGLIVDLHKQRLIDSLTQVASTGTIKASPNLCISVLDRLARYSEILSEFPEITGITPATVNPKCDVFHHIVTSGPPRPSAPGD